MAFQSQQLIQLMSRELKLIAEFCDSSIVALKGPIESLLPAELPEGADTGWEGRTPLQDVPTDLRSLIECQLTWKYRFAPGGKRLALMYVGVAPLEQDWLLVTRIYLRRDFFKAKGTSREAERDLPSYIARRGLEPQIRLGSPLPPIRGQKGWEGIIQATPVLTAIEQPDQLREALSAGKEAIELLAGS